MENQFYFVSLLLFIPAMFLENIDREVSIFPGIHLKIVYTIAGNKQISVYSPFFEINGIKNIRNNPNNFTLKNTNRYFQILQKSSLSKLTLSFLFGFQSHFYKGFGNDVYRVVLLTKTGACSR